VAEKRRGKEETHKEERRCVGDGHMETRVLGKRTKRLGKRIRTLSVWMVAEKRRGKEETHKEGKGQEKEFSEVEGVWKLMERASENVFVS
jgi:hypothetical protein